MSRTERIRLATYNIHGARGRDGRRAPDRIAEIVRRLDADVVALQEVDARRSRSNKSDTFRFLADATGMHAVPGPTMLGDEGNYGNLLLARRAPARVERIDLSVDGYEPRGAVVARFETPVGIVRVAGTHLGLAAAERRAQTARLLAHLAPADGIATVLLGDLNEWRPRSAVYRALHRRLGPGRAVRSFPAGRPILALDRIWTDRGLRVLRLHAVRDPLTRVASDHLPVVAEIARA